MSKPTKWEVEVPPFVLPYVYPCIQGSIPLSFWHSEAPQTETMGGIRCPGGSHTGMTVWETCTSPTLCHRVCKRWTSPRYMQCSFSALPSILVFVRIRIKSRGNSSPTYGPEHIPRNYGRKLHSSWSKSETTFTSRMGSPLYNTRLFPVRTSLYTQFRVFFGY